MRLEELLKEKKAERLEIAKRSEPIRKQRDELRNKIQPMEDQLHKLNDEIKAIESEKLFELDNDIGALTRALGAKRLQAES